MDYKELIRRLVECDQWDEAIRNDELSLALEDAADAIEALLAERDAALDDLRGMCWCCAHGKPWEKAGPLSKLTGCEHLAEAGALACGGRNRKCPHWQWRGPQEEPTP